MTELLRFGLVTLGLIYLLTESVIFAPIRVAFGRVHWFLRLLIYCTACTGFWVGLALGAIGLYPGSEGVVLRAIEAGFAAMAVGALWSTFHVNAAALDEQEAFHAPEEETPKDVRAGQ